MNDDILMNAFVMGKDYLANDLYSFLFSGSRGGKRMPNPRRGGSKKLEINGIIHVLKVKHTLKCPPGSSPEHTAL